MGGTAISAFTTVRITDAYGPEAPFVLVACVLAVYAVVAALLLRDKPGRPVPQGSFLARTWATARIPATGQLSLLYALGFGGFVAFSVYLPTYLVNAYGLTASDAAARTAGFVVLAVAMRPVGGTLSDRVGPVPVLAGRVRRRRRSWRCVAALELPLVPVATIAFLGLAAALGASSGAVFALVAQVAPADKVGAVTGIVGAAGGLGGFFPPLVMGAVYDLVGDYSLGYVLLAASAFAVAWFTWGPVRRAALARAAEARHQLGSPHDDRAGTPTGPGRGGRRGAAADAALPARRTRCRRTCARCTRSAGATRTRSTGTAGATTRWSGPRTA